MDHEARVYRVIQGYTERTKVHRGTQENSGVYLTVTLRGRARYELIYITNEAELVIISSYPASPRRITVLVNFQAIFLIFSGETSSNCNIFFTEDAANKFFPTFKISAQEIRHQFFLIWSNLTIMAHIMGLGNQSESWKIIILS